MTTTNPLLRPLRFRCGAFVHNRLALAPLTNTQSGDDGVLSEQEARWLLRRARGGFGLVETCAAYVTPAGKAFDGQLGICTDEQEAAVHGLARGIVAAGALGIAQLVHGGMRSPSRLTGRQPVAPSGDYVEQSMDFERPRGLSTDELFGVLDAFVDAAIRCARAGFSGVELHAAHGYLLSQFLSRTMNTRTDGWGGTLEGRARPLRTLVQRVRARTPVSFVVGVRVSPEDRGNARGLDLDETIQVARWCADDGADFVHLSLWDATKNTQKRPEAHAARLFRDALPRDVAVIAAGGVWTRDDALALSERGADIIAVGRAAIVDPDWVRHVVSQGAAPIRPPRTPAQLAAVDVGPRFVTYLRRWPNFVVD